MPYYDLCCKTCGNTFNAKATMAERSNGGILCPKCGSNEHEAVFKTLNYVVKKNNCDTPSCPQAHRCGSGCCHR